jgi:transposase
VARPSEAVRQVEQRVRALPRLGKAGVFKRLFDAASDEPDMEYAMVDARSLRSTVTDRAQKGDAKSGDRQVQGRYDDQNPRSGRCAGNLVHFVLLPGQRFDTVGVEPLIEGINFGALIGDKAFDSNTIIAALNKRGAKIVISQHPRRAQPLKIDKEMYKWRHLIENFFCKLKEFKRIAMRCDKTDQSFTAMIYLAAAVINSR